ncbi:MAG: ribosome small subunit-dependent GTPase A [Bacteroidales bacterium]|nr:ribosome small subunit-dependent GTPase A [Bacteroidales bacterium]
MEGVVIRSTGSWYSVLTQDENVINSRLKGIFRTKGIRTTNPIAVGDHVEIALSQKEDENVITKILPRRNYMIRRATRLSKASHIIAANLDCAFLIVTLASPRTSLGFIDRFLVTAEAYHIPSVLIFNKIDLLVTSKEINRLNEIKHIYTSIGYACYEVSALTGAGIENVKQDIINKVSLFSGHSGVGKSALINVIEPQLFLKTGAISEYHQKGMHTTTFAEMLPLSFGGFIIDTPGIKEFGMIDLKKEEVSHYFPEMAALIHQCAFHNCTHTHEPNCAVKKAVEDGTISESRYQNYLSILNDESFYIADWKR